MASYFNFIFSFYSRICWLTSRISFNFFLFLCSSSDLLLVILPMSPSKSFFCFWMVIICSFNYWMIIRYSSSLFFCFFSSSYIRLLSCFSVCCFIRSTWMVISDISCIKEVFYFLNFVIFYYFYSHYFSNSSIFLSFVRFLLNSSYFSLTYLPIYFLCFFISSPSTLCTSSRIYCSFSAWSNL